MKLLVKLVSYLVLVAAPMSLFAVEGLMVDDGDASTSSPYAPVQPKVEGTMKLACLGIKYKNAKQFTTASQCLSLAKAVSKFYSINSQGQLKIVPYGFMVEVPFEGNEKNYYTAEAYAIAKHPGFDMYANVGIFVGTPHSGNHIAHLKNTLYRDAEHEVGHLLGLGHAGAYKPDANGKLVLDPYGDGQSVMGASPSANLTAPQYYHEGWTDQNEVALYQPGQTYQLKRVVNFKGEGLSSVLIPAPYLRGGAADPNYKLGSQRDVFVAFPTDCPKGCAALYFSNDLGAGTQRIKIFGGEFYDTNFTGAHIKFLNKSASSITISIDFNAPPKASFIAPDTTLEAVSLDAADNFLGE